ncbi:MAG: NAD(P)/FAD-dependent oxidoreductase [Actinomycetota bacterium]|nr:NAD(P)/FAD-dependent oxidoreductase [Actinomycetota bacterium]
MAPSLNGSQRPISVGIVGAGFGGVGIGIRLRQKGIEDFQIFERGDSVGGVWRANTYPGAACDVPSHLYSFSFAPGHNWSRRFAPQPEILAYLEEITDRFGIRPHLKLGDEVTAARFDAGSGRWTVTTAAGDEREFDVLVTACGQLTRPQIPRVEGIEDFEGRVFHSAEWDHSHDLAGRNVAVIGTGASAIQFVPEIAAQVGKLTVYQRSAPWILPKVDREYPPWERRLFKRFPARVAAARAALFTFFEVGTYGFTGKDWVLAPLAKAADSFREKELSDPVLRARSTPDYAFGCKRLLLTSDWYSTLRLPHVELLSGAVTRVTPSGVVGADGIEREADTIIWGTGFDASRFVLPMDVHGLDGKTLESEWGDSPEAFLGTTVSGFPNMFLMYGPNTGHGSGGVPYTLESQFNYVVDAIRRLRSDGLRWIDLRPETQAAWRQEIEERSRDTVWTTGGCTSWYTNAEGRNTNNWVGPWLEYRRRTRRINPAHYRAGT